MVVRIQKHHLNYVADPVLEIKKQDWIIIRLMYMVLAIDPTMMKVDEIVRSKKYLEDRYRWVMDGARNDIVERAFSHIARDPIAQDTFNNVKDVRLVRDFDKTATHVTEQTGWRFSDE
jgi:hypothetical protein